MLRLYSGRIFSFSRALQTRVLECIATRHVQGSTLEALALKAKDAAKQAMEQELVVQAKVKAALERQARKHKVLVKQLEAQGWRLSVSDKASRGSLRKSRERFEELLRSEEYAKQR